MSSAIDQTPGPVGAPVIMEQTDLIQGGIVPQGTTGVTVFNPGVYFIVAAPQVRDLPTFDDDDSDEDDNDSSRQSCLDFWLRVNGTDVSNSNVQICFPGDQHYTDVIVAQAIVRLQRFDLVQVIASAPHAQGGFLDAITVAGEPLIPSIIFSMFRIGR